ncbi:XRE family transcriptional regulator [Campylobacter fetus]|uniref:XRE family transcriptional regulator n=3 Tax=Campylobacter fetus TaxID=196 RepID=UPI00138E54FA|nr:LexA family transcriptional regulator [Campylobacter fetus]
MNLAQKIKLLRSEKDWTQYDLAQNSGVSLQSIKMYEAEKNKGITTTILKKIANALNVNVEFFLDSEFGSSISSSISSSKNKKSSSICRQSPNLSSNKPLNTPNLKKSQDRISISVKEDTVYIPFFKDGAVSAGFGTEDFGNDCDFLPFKKQDLRLMFGAHSTANIGIIPCVGNSMQPTIEEGELVVFQQDNTQSEGAIYVVRFESELFVKRLKKRPLQLISDNKDYQPIALEEVQEIEILGRVIGSYSIKTKRF